MVVGLETFRRYFAGFEDHYAIIGGTACFLVFDDVGLDFRATKDIDLVLCVEVIAGPFLTRLAEFLEDGGYKARQRSSGRKEFYRFHQPARDDFPFMLELFAREPGSIDLPDAGAFTRLPVEEEVISLSAILLDPDYFAALQANRRVVDGVSVLDERLLIPFKARAFVDLTRRRQAGEPVKSKDIRKHRADVYRLLQLLPGNARVDVAPAIQADLQTFIDFLMDETAFAPQDFDVPITKEDGLERLRETYALPAPAGQPAPP